MCKANPIAQTNLQFPLFQSDMKEIRSISCLPNKTRNWGGPSGETTETEAPCHSRRGTIKIPCCSPSPKVVMSAGEWYTERDGPGELNISE